MRHPVIKMIVAMTRQRVIGQPGALPWYIPDDLKRFKKITQGHTVIMGRNTFESIGRPLPNRNNIVLSFAREEIPGVEVCVSIEEALARAKAYGAEIFVIGGASIYEQMLPLTDVLYVSHVKKDYPGTIYFPSFDQN